MKKLLVILSALLGFALANIATAGIPNNDDPKTFLGPTLRGSYTDYLRGNTAYSVLGEVGVKNFRVGGTMGMALDVTQRLKLSAEYLVQRITYPFFTGNTDQWVDQGAIGAGYQYDFLGYAYEPQFNLSAFLSHASNKNLSTVTGTYVDINGVNQSFSNFRRIAGSNAGGIAPGIGFKPWLGGLAMLDLNYDKVKYDKRYVPDENAIGFGGTIKLRQAFTDSFDGGVSVAIRKPFNNYQVDFSWHNVPYFGDWNIGAFGAYTAGKHTLPDTYNVGVNFDFVMDHPIAMTTRGHGVQSLTQWIAQPAVYLPQVLAIPDERVETFSPPVVCAAGIPTVIGILPDVTAGGVTLVSSAVVFTGSALTYSIAVSPSPAPSTVTINPTTGVVTISPVPGGTDVTFTVTVTATNACGSASTSFDVTVPSD